MVDIVVYAKKSNQILYKNQSSHVKLDQSSVVQLDLDKSDIASMIRKGNDLQITLKNGEKIIIENYFKIYEETENTLLISHSNQLDQVIFDDQGVFQHYSSIALIDPIQESLPNVLQTMTAPTESALLSKMDMLKIGLGLALVEGTYLAYYDSNSSSSPSSSSNTDSDPTSTVTTPTAYLSSDNLKITGVADANVAIYIQDLEGNYLGNTTTDSSGNYTITLVTALPEGEVGLVYAINSAGTVSGFSYIQGLDITPPDVPVVSISYDGLVVSGTTETKSTVYVVDQDGNILGKTTSDDGTYTITLDTALSEGQEVTVYAVDPSGNKSDLVTATAVIDTTVPDMPEAYFNDDGTLIYGTAELGSTVYIQDADGNILAQGVATDGTYSIPLDTALINGETVYVYAQDAAGNTSENNVLTAIDITPPVVSEAYISQDGLHILGIADHDSIIYILDSDGNIVAQGQVYDGSFTIDLDNAISPETTLYVYAEDPAGNKSALISVQTELVNPEIVDDTPVTDDDNLDTSVDPQTLSLLIDTDPNPVVTTKTNLLSINDNTENADTDSSSNQSNDTIDVNDLLTNQLITDDQTISALINQVTDNTTSSSTDTDLSTQVNTDTETTNPISDIVATTTSNISDIHDDLLATQNLI